MSESPDVPKDNDFAVVAMSQCCRSRACHWVDTQPPVVELVSLQKTSDNLTLTGRVPMLNCPVCGFAVEAISKTVPIELQALNCHCGHSDFRFAIRSLKPNKTSGPTEWRFDLDVICRQCERRKFRKRIFNFFRLKKLQVGATGVAIEMSPLQKS
jgi:hypothetical protein